MPRSTPSRRGTATAKRRARQHTEAVVRVAVRGGPFPGADRAVLRRRAHKMLDHLALGPVELSLALVDDPTMRALNRSYRRIDRPTDVLAFPLAPGEPVVAERRLLGDVVLSVETARRQARARGRSLLAELTMLLAHGLLHLLGYRHDRVRQAEQMNARVRELEQAAQRRASRHG